jgi:hypothetical protein
MTKIKLTLLLSGILLFSTTLYAQQKHLNDSTKHITTYSGSLGLTNNGFSIIPTFSLNSPAVIALLSWQKDKFSIDPEIRLSNDLKKGSILLWFRYYAIKKNKFTLRVGAHPALNFQLREITTNGTTSTISQMRRFLAWELSPTYHIKKNWSAGIYYLQGNGLQKDGPRTTHFVTLNTNISNINVGGNFRFMLSSAVYYLYLDGYDGRYITATGTLSNTKWPFSLQSSINKTFTANLPGNKDFLWNVSLNYVFRKHLMQLKSF